MSAEAIQLDIYRTAIPMRRFEHAAAARNVAEAILVRLDLSDGPAGWGETLPRPYVTGETMETVEADLASVLWPALLAELAGSSDLARAAEALPDRAPGGRCITAARCALELACLDALWARGESAAGGACALPGRELRRRIGARVSGVLGSADPARTARRLRLMRWYGLRDFKLKLGLRGAADAANATDATDATDAADAADVARLRIVHRRLGKAIAAGLCTLRVDVNGGWTARQTPQRIAELDLEALGVCVVEQPTFCPPGELVELARRCPLPLMADESLLTVADARILLAEPARVWWNIRISKNGGLLRALALAELAAGHGVTWTGGCMVGESGILSAAQRRLLQLAPTPRFVEGNYGRFLLADDLTAPSPRMGWGGRLSVLAGPGLGAAISPRGLARYATPRKTLRA